MLLANAFPLLHLGAALAVGCVAGGARGWLGAAAVLYLFPPLAARLLTAACATGRPLRPRPFSWWITQLQTLSRSLLEEPCAWSRLYWPGCAFGVEGRRAGVLVRRDRSPDRGYLDGRRLAPGAA